MNRIYFKKLSLILAVLFISHSFAVADDESDLAQARKMVEEKKYDKAVDKYLLLKELVRSNVDLHIELARVYSYKDDHENSIREYQAVLHSHPEKENEIIYELANQYKWNGNLEEALSSYKKALDYDPDNEQFRSDYAEVLSWLGRRSESLIIYNEILESNPLNIDVMLQKAEVLSWDDRLEEAEEVYERVLNLEPVNQTARNGIARVNVWKGYHRKGIELYNDILADNPEDEVALEGLVYAWHWEGNDTEAVQYLKRVLKINPERKEARKLYYQIINTKHPFIRSNVGYSKDKYDLAIFTHSLIFGDHLGNDFFYETIWDRTRYRKPGFPVIDANRGGLGFSHRINDYFEINSYSYFTHFDSSDFSPYTNASWFTYKPYNQLRFDLSYNREIFEDMTAIDNHIIANRGALSFDYKPNRFWFFSGKYSRGYFSDGNKDDTLLAKIEYRLNQTPFIKLYYNYYYADYSEQKFNGYFNPEWIQAHTLGVYASHRFTEKFFAEGQASVGYEAQDPGIRHPTYFAAAGLSYSIMDNWLISARAEYFDARPDMPSKGYSRKALMLSLTYNFGGETTEIRNATVPARPIPGQY